MWTETLKMVLRGAGDEASVQLLDAGYLHELESSPGTTDLMVALIQSSERCGGQTSCSARDIARFFKKREGQTVYRHVMRHPECLVPYVEVVHKLAAHHLAVPLYMRYTPSYGSKSLEPPSLLPFVDFGFLMFFAGRKYMNLRMFERFLTECLDAVQPVDHEDPTGWLFKSMCHKFNIPTGARKLAVRSCAVEARWDAVVRREKMMGPSWRSSP